MKVQFKEWLINLNDEFINSLGIEDILIRLDDELNIINANKEEAKLLISLLDMFEAEV